MSSVRQPTLVDETGHVIPPSIRGHLLRTCVPTNTVNPEVTRLLPPSAVLLETHLSEFTV